MPAAKRSGRRRDLDSLWLRRAGELALALVIGWPVVQLGRVFAARLTYPFDLEWCESGSLYHVHRLLEGLPLYGGEGSPFLPFPYPPGYYALVAPLGWLFGLDYWCARFVSIVFLGAYAFVITREIHAHTGRTSAGALTAGAALGVAAVGFPLVDGFYDLARVDSTMIGLAAIGAAIVGVGRLSPLRAGLAALVLTLAVFTKQTNAFFVAWLCVFALLRDRRSGLWLGALTGGACLVTLGALTWASGGAFYEHVIAAPQTHEVRPAALLGGLERVHDFAPFAALIPFLALGLALTRRLRARTILWVGMWVAAVPASLLPYAKIGGWSNNLMPLVLFSAPATIMLLSDLAPTLAASRRVVHYTIAAALALFVYERSFDPSPHIPTALDRAAAEGLNRTIGELEGGVLIPELPFVAVRNGHRNEQWHEMGYFDMDAAGRPYDVARMIEQAGARWSVLGDRGQHARFRAIRAGHRRAREIPAAHRPRMFSGMRMSLDAIFERRPPDPD